MNLIAFSLARAMLAMIALAALMLTVLFSLFGELDNAKLSCGATVLFGCFALIAAILERPNAWVQGLPRSRR